MSDYSFFYAVLDPNGDPVFVSDTSPQIETVNKYVYHLKEIHYIKISQRFYNVMPEDESINHCPYDTYYFTSKRMPSDGSGNEVFYVIYNKEELAFGPDIMRMVSQARAICMVAVGAVSLLFAYFEILPAKRAWVHQKQFIANTSHELRTPITVINTVLENKKDIEQSEECKKNDLVIKGEMDILTSIVNGLMFLSRADVKQIKLSKESVDIYTLLLETFIAAEVLAEPKSITFEDFKSDELIIFADNTLIRQLMKILLSNAIQYTQVGGKISLSCKRIGSKVEIAVEDNGIGIAKKEMKLIFNRFYRVDKTKSANIGNSGLGLSIAKWIVTKHGGRIRVDSTIGKGSKFIVTLPIKRPASIR